MTYRELLEYYKKNELDESKKTEVEADIEKQEAISDYLYEKAEIPIFETSLEELKTSSEQNKDTQAEEHMVSKQEREFMKRVNRSIRRAFLKMGIVIGAVILVIILFVQLALPKVVSSFYYNPGKEVAENTNQLSLDMAVYTELYIPCYVRTSASVEDRGYGNYDICINQNISYNGLFTNLSGRIDRGRLTLYDINVLKKPASNAFAWYQVRGDISDSLTNLIPEEQSNLSAAANPSQASERLKQLDEKEIYVAYVTLERMMKYEDFKKFIDDGVGLSDVWCAVRTTESNVANDYMFRPEDNIGFQCTLGSSSLLNWDRDNYPYLSLWDVSEMNNMGKLSEEDFMKTHFTSMLRYMSKQKKFLSMMNEYEYTYSNAIDYVEKNGLIIYGFAVLTNKEMLLELDKRDEIYEIYTQPLR